MEYICMICGSRQHVLREGQVMLCTRCITALGIALHDKLEALHGTQPGLSLRHGLCRATSLIRGRPIGQSRWAQA